MRNSISGITIPALIVGALLTGAMPHEAAAEVSVGVNINLGPPPITVAEPPAVVLVPRSQVYFVPGVAFDVFFHNGYWWSPRGDRWYRARAYNGPWNIVERRYVPRSVIRVPRDYRNVYVRERHIPYGQWRKERARHERREIREERHERREDFHERREHGGGEDRGGHGRGR
jgi:hypothetical protein